MTSEPIENFAGVEFQPICVASSTVLMPFVKEQVKIGRAAQLSLLRDVMRANLKTFGVVYASSASEIPPVGTIGCVGIIRSINLCKSGGKIVKTVGIVRFQISEYIEEDAYPIAKVEYIRVESDSEEDAQELSRELARLMRDTIDKAAASVGNPPSHLPVPDVPAVPFSFMLADVFDFDMETRLKLLNLRSTCERLEICREKILEFEDECATRAENREFLNRFSNIYNPNHK